MEMRADYDRALQQWRILYNSEPGRQDYYDGVRRVLLAMGRYEEAEALVREWYETRPGWISPSAVLADWGEVKLLAGDEEAAREKFELAIAKNAGPGGYLAVSNVLARNRRLEEAIDLLHRARTELKDETLFAFQLAPLLRQRMEWASSAHEYLLALRGSKLRPDAALRGLAMIPAEDLEHDPVAEQIRAELAHIKDEGESWQGHRDALLRALADRSKNLGDFATALPVISELDSLSLRPGFALVRFASEAMDHGDEATATRALDIAAARLDDPLRRSTVTYARADLAQRRGDYSLSERLFGEVIESAEAEELLQGALYRRGNLRQAYLHRPELAAEDYRSLLERESNQYLHEARNGLATCYASLDSLQKALDVLAAPMPGEPEGFATPVPSGDVEAGLLAARISLWQGRQELASNLLGWVLMPPEGKELEGESFNLLRILTSTDSSRLDSFALADHAEFKDDLAQALPLYRQLAVGQDELAREAGWRAGLLALRQDDPEPLSRYAEQEAGRPRGAEAWLKLADWHEERGELDEAVGAVESLLIADPQGLLTPIARLKRERYLAEVETRPSSSVTP